MPAPLTTIVFETHSLSEDNELGIATGWQHGKLSVRGRELARDLGLRRRADNIAAVLVSDLRRATETAELAFGDVDIPILHDWRLRECDYGELNGAQAGLVHGAIARVHQQYPGGESWAEAIRRVGGALGDIDRRWRGRRVLIIGHMSAYWSLEHYVHGMPLDEIGQRFAWQEGWEYAIANSFDEDPPR